MKKILDNERQAAWKQSLHMVDGFMVFKVKLSTFESIEASPSCQFMAQ